MWTACSGYIGKPPADIDPSIPSSDSSALRMQFPMWLMPGKILATLQPPLLPHEELLQEGKLVRWEPGHPNTVVFISHEWIGSHHPDPAFKQFRVLQQALQNLMAGAVTIRKDTVSEFLNIPLATLSESMQRRCLDWDFWYDFISCPQLGVSGGLGASIEEKSASKRGLAAAIASIPAYCEKADLTVVLAPSVLHSDVHQVLSTSSWSSRGWCRAERTATVFSSASSASKKVLLVVSGPTQISISGGPEWISAWPGQGKFTIEHDRTVLQDLTGELLATKCENLLRSGQSQWRFYQALLPKARGRADFEREGLDHFLRRYRIPDSHCVVHGMTPLMLASLEGNISVMRELLESKADVDELIAWRLPEGHIQGKSVTALLLAASLSSKEAVATLLDARASLDLPSGVSGSGIVVQAAYFGNSDVLATLIERRGDMDCPTFLGGNALLAAAGSPSVDSTRILLEHRANPNYMNYIGATPVAFNCIFNTDAEHAQLLLDARADPNQRGVVKSCLWAGLSWACQKKVQLGSATMIHWNIAVSNGGTPLHVAALNGSLQIALLLLDRDADLDATWGDKELTPLQLAMLHGHQDLVACLSERSFLHIHQTEAV